MYGFGWIKVYVYIKDVSLCVYSLHYAATYISLHTVFVIFIIFLSFFTTAFIIFIIIIQFNHLSLLTVTYNYHSNLFRMIAMAKRMLNRYLLKHVVRSSIFLTNAAFFFYSQYKLLDFMNDYNLFLFVFLFFLFCPVDILSYIYCC